LSTLKIIVITHYTFNDTSDYCSKLCINY